jgi:hypothetical protein
MTELIEVKSGVRQGDPLSTLLFSIVIDVIIKRLNSRGNISTRLMQTRNYNGRYYNAECVYIWMPWMFVIL